VREASGSFVGQVPGKLARNTVSVGLGPWDVQELKDAPTLSRRKKGGVPSIPTAGRGEFALRGEV
jgi:hypothetical protein